MGDITEKEGTLFLCSSFFLKRIFSRISIAYLIAIINVCLGTGTNDVHIVSRPVQNVRLSLACH